MLEVTCKTIDSKCILGISSNIDKVVVTDPKVMKEHGGLSFAYCPICGTALLKDDGK